MWARGACTSANAAARSGATPFGVDPSVRSVRFTRRMLEQLIAALSVPLGASLERAGVGFSRFSRASARLAKSTPIVLHSGQGKPVTVLKPRLISFVMSDRAGKMRVNPFTRI